MSEIGQLVKRNFMSTWSCLFMVTFYFAFSVVEFCFMTRPLFQLQQKIFASLFKRFLKRFFYTYLIVSQNIITNFASAPKFNKYIGIYLMFSQKTVEIYHKSKVRKG